MESIIQSRKECFICGAKDCVHDHHIFFGTAKRSKSEKYGLKVYLCGYHHNLSDEGVHFNRELDLKLKRLAQTKFEETYGDRTKFIQEFGKSYL